MKYASTISLIAVTYISLLVAYFFFKGNKPIKTIDDGYTPSSLLALNTTDDATIPVRNQIEYFKWSVDFFRVLPIFVFAYTCHQNVIIYISILNNNIYYHYYCCCCCCCCC